jgi:Fic family protein
MSNLLGQCYAYIQAISNTPIRPDYRRQLLQVSLKKGAQATTAIEGNTLSEDEIEVIVRGEKLPPSKEYLEKEVTNILKAFNTILEELTKKNEVMTLSSDVIKRFQHMVGDGIGETFASSPGHFRRNNVIVGNYRPPSFEKIDDLIDKLCTWLLKHFHYTTGQNFNEIIIQAIVTHIYIAWIHPFSDGNGRTARLLEFYLLLRAGVPDIASHILSNHYNETRAEYYLQLQQATETGSLTNFINYALQGFRDGLEEVLQVIHKSQIDMTWRNYVHDIINTLQEEGKSSKTVYRIRQLAFHIPNDRFVAIPEIKITNEKIYTCYKKLSDATLSRDLQILTEKNILERKKNMFRAKKEVLHSFFPTVRSNITRSW